MDMGAMRTQNTLLALNEGLHGAQDLAGRPWASPCPAQLNMRDACACAAIQCAWRTRIILNYISGAQKTSSPSSCGQQGKSCSCPEHGTSLMRGEVLPQKFWPDEEPHTLRACKPCLAGQVCFWHAPAEACSACVDYIKLDNCSARETRIQKPASS